MIKSINYWAFPNADQGKCQINDCFEQAMKAGFEAVELCVDEKGVLTPNTSQRECELIREDAQRAGISIASLATGLHWEYSFTDNRTFIREKAVKITKKMLQITAWLDVDTLLVIPGLVTEKVPYEVAYKRAREGIRKVSPTAERLKVYIGIENVWNKFLLSPLEMRDFIDSFKSKYVAAYFDIGNVLISGYPEQWINILGKRIKKVHIKDFKLSVGTLEGFCDLLEGDVPFKEVIKALKKIGYKGPVTAELMPYKEGLIERTSKAC